MGGDDGFPVAESQAPGDEHLTRANYKLIPATCFVVRRCCALRFSYASPKYQVLLPGLLLFHVLWKRERAWQLAKRNLIAILFLGAYIGTYFSLYAWVVPISPGNRLVLSLFAPLLFGTSIGLRDSAPRLSMINGASGCSTSCCCPGSGRMSSLS
jgi:hypothetical protein